MSVIHYYLTERDGLYSQLLLGAMNDVEDQAASAMGFAPGVWLDPQLDSGESLEAMRSESALTTSNSDGS